MTGNKESAGAYRRTERSFVCSFILLRKSSGLPGRKRPPAALGQHVNLRICKFMKSLSMVQKCRRRYAVYKENHIVYTDRKDGWIV